MIGELILKAREDKGMTKAELARKTNMNFYHIANIEKGDRFPSLKALKSICAALEIPYQPLMQTFDKELSEKHLKYKIVNHISYNKVLAVDLTNNFVNCPKEAAGCTFAVKLPDNSMAPLFEKDTLAFVEINSPLNSSDIGLFEYEGKTFIRKFCIRDENITLKALNPTFDDIKLTKNSQFYIIGKIIKTN